MLALHDGGPKKGRKVQREVWGREGCGAWALKIRNAEPMRKIRDLPDFAGLKPMRTLQRSLELRTKPVAGLGSVPEPWLFGFAAAAAAFRQQEWTPWTCLAMQWLDLIEFGVIGKAALPAF